MDRKEWNKIYRDLPSIPPLDVSEPPCPQCKYWRPQPKVAMVKGAQVVQGVILCHAEDMYRDFSCFEQREAADEREA